MRKVFYTALALVLLTGMIASAQTQRGFVKHDVQFKDDLGRAMEISSLNIYLANSTTNATIYTERDLAAAITQPLTEASTNTTLVNGHVTWFGPDAWEFSATTSDGRVVTSASAPSLDASTGSIVIPIWYAAVNTASYSDAQTISLGTDGDWVFAGGATAKRLTLTPAADASTLYIGDGTSSSDVRIYGSSASIYAQFDESSDQLDLVHYDLHADDDTDVIFGTDSDFVVESDTTKILEFVPAANSDDYGVYLGIDTYGVDLKAFAATTGDYMKWDASDESLEFVDASVSLGDADPILLGDNVGTGDFNINATTNVLNIGQVVADTGTMTIGADNAGMDVTFFGESASAYLKWDATSADQLILTGVDSSGTLFAITGVDTSGGSDTVTIAHSGAGDAIQITDGSATSVAINAISAANQTTSVVKVDGATGNWIGANDVGALHVSGDTAGAHVGASLLQVVNSAQPIASAEGFLARFVDTGTARTDAYAVEIETTNTTPALYLNNQFTISGADSAGTLFDITAIDTTGNTDTMTIAHSGSGDALQITCTEADSVAANLVAAASQTTSVLKVDGATGSWLGANGVGMVNLTSDGALAHVNSSLLYINNTGVPQNDSRGSSLRIVDSGNAAAGTAGYAVYISATDATVEALYIDDGKVLVDEEIVSNRGVQSASVAVTADVEANQATIPAGSRFVTITSDGATKVVCLPVCVVGNMITIYCAATGCELQTLAGSNDTINTVDCDGDNELAIAAGKVYHFVCVADGVWSAYGWAANGTAEAALTPDADS